MRSFKQGKDLWAASTGRIFPPCFAWYMPCMETRQKLTSRSRKPGMRPWLLLYLDCVKLHWEIPFYEKVGNQCSFIGRSGMRRKLFHTTRGRWFHYIDGVANVAMPYSNTDAVPTNIFQRSMDSEPDSAPNILLFICEMKRLMKNAVWRNTW